jgi:hypothetical protein
VLAFYRKQAEYNYSAGLTFIRSLAMDEWVLKKFREAYCDNKGDIIAPRIDFNAFRESLKTQRPDEVNEVTSAVKR